MNLDIQNGLISLEKVMDIVITTAEDCGIWERMKI